MELITNNIETIITFFTMVITWILGAIKQQLTNYLVLSEYIINENL